MLKKRERVSWLNVKLEGVRSTRDSKQRADLSSQPPKRGPKAGDPFLPSPPRSFCCKNEAEVAETRVTGLSETGSPAIGPSAEEGIVAPSQPRAPKLCLPNARSRQARADLGGQNENPSPVTRPGAGKGASRPRQGSNRAVT